MFDDAVASLSQREGFWFSQRLACRRVGVDGVGFPVSPCSSSWPDDLPDLDVVGHQVPGQAGSVRAGSLDADELDLTEGSDEREKLFISGSRGRYLSVSQSGTSRAQDRDVVGISVGADSSNDRRIFGGTGAFCGSVCHH